MILVLIAAAGFVAGFINVLAGGGSFITLPALVAGGLTALGANATSTVALFPAQAMTTWLARRDIVMPADDAGGISVRMLAVISTIGGLFGALLLLVTPPGVFARIVPWLILFATAVFAHASFGGGMPAGGRFGLPRRYVYVYVVQSVVAIYGGYFGGGIGIMMLAALALFGLTDMRVMTSIKILLAMLMNVAAVGTFVIAGLVAWPQALVLMAGAVVGGAAGIVAARRVPALWVRVFVVVAGLALTVVFFLRQGH
jgi:uncharacterized protein